MSFARSWLAPVAMAWAGTAAGHAAALPPESVVPALDSYETLSKVPSRRDTVLSQSRSLARCVVAKDDPVGSTAKAWLLKTEAERAPKQQSVPVVRLVWSACDRLSTTPLPFGAGIFEGLLAEAVLRNAVPELAVRPSQSAFAAAWTSRSPAGKLVDEAAICLADRHPAEVARLIRSKPKSSEEGRQFASLAAPMQSCPNGNAIGTLDRSIARLAITKAYFHRAFGRPSAAAVDRERPKRADPPLGSRIPRPAELIQDNPGKLRSAFIACAYARQPALVTRILATSDPTGFDFKAIGFDASQVSDKLALDKCLGKAMTGLPGGLEWRMNLPTFRAMMLEAAYLASYPSPPALLGALPPSQRRYVSGEGAIKSARELGDLADCIVQADPVGSDALLRTPAGSSFERATAKALVPALVSCVPANQTIEMTVIAIRGFAADGLWTATLQPAEVQKAAS